jgi:RNA polymerase sigma factor (sigma-70 family)
MAEAHPNPVVQHLRHLLGSVQAAAMTDGQLLERFLSSRDETAVEVLVRRYGPLILGVCRRVLHNAHAAEDAFQATFLVLLRKAPSLDRGKPLGSWLYTVAYRLALRARANEARRRQCEARAAQGRPDPEGQPPRSSDLAVALEEELQKLPEKHRAPLVLCYLEGKTNEEAAQALGCPRGSVSARLAHARERLRACLARRGYRVPAGGLAALLTAAAADAAVPVPLLANTVRTALWFAAEGAGKAGLVSAGAVALARGAVRAMALNKLKAGAAVLLVTALLGAGATLLLSAAPQGHPVGKQPAAEARADRANAPGGRLPGGVLARMGTTRLRHGGAVYFAAYTPDGKGLVTAGSDRTVRLWDLATGEETRRFDWDPEQPAGKAQPSPESLADKRERQFWDDTARSCQAALSTDGKLVAASRGGAVCLWQTASGKVLHRLRTGEKRLSQLAFAADGKSLLTLGPGARATAVWDVATGKCLRCSPGKLAPMYFAPPGLIAQQLALASPNLKHLAICGRDKRGIPWICIRDFASGMELHRFGAGSGTMAMTFSADGRTLAWDHFPEDGIVLVDVRTGKERRHLKRDGRNDPAMALALSADGKSLAVCGLSHTLELWDLASGKRTGVACRVTDAQLEQQSVNWLSAMVCPALAFSPDGKKVVCGLGGPAVRQFRADTGEEVPGPGSGPRAPVSTLALSADGQSLWTYGTGEPARSWDWRAGRETGQRRLPAGATHAVFAADGRLGFAAEHSFTLCGPGRAGGKKTWKIADEIAPLVALALSPDGQLLATRNILHPEVHLWDATTAAKRFTLGSAGQAQGLSPETLAETTGVLLPDLIFSPDGRYLAGAGPSRQLCLWDTATGAPVWEVLPRAGQAIERFAFSPSGGSLACLYADRTVVLYEGATGARRARLGAPDRNHRRVYLTSGNQGPLNEFLMQWDAPVCLAFSADGRYLATAQHTPEIRLWDVMVGRPVGRLQGHQGGVVNLLFAPDGRHLFSGGRDTTVLTWDLARLTRARRGSPDPAASAPSLDALWTDLAAEDAARAFAAMRQLCASPQETVTLIQQRVPPVAAPDAKRLAKLLADLESDRFESRRRAEAELRGLGDRAEPALRKALADDPPLDLRQRLERLLKRSGKGPPAELRRNLRAVEVLELIGSPDARRVLQALAGGVPSARLTREAKSASKRLAKRVIRP